MATLTKSEIAALSPAERLALLDDLWCSFKEDPDSLPTPAWHWEVIEARLAAQERSSRPIHSWESVKSEMENDWLS